MATSGRIETGRYNYTNFYFQWQLVGQDTNGNFSRINWQVGINITSNAYWGSNSIKLLGGNVNGYNYPTGTWSSISGNGDHHLRTGTLDIGHDSNGGKVFGADVLGNLYGGGNLYTNGSWQLPSIPRQAYMTAHIGSWNDEQNPWVEFSNAGGFPVNVWLEIMGARRFQFNSVGSRFTWNFTEADREYLRGLIPNNNSTGVRMVVETNIGGTYYADWRDNTFSIINANPTFTDFTYKDTNPATVAVTGNDQIMVQGKSTVRATVSPANKMTPIKKSTAVNYTATMDGVVDTEPFSATDPVLLDVGVMNSVGLKSLSVRATDSRGNSATVAKDVTIIPYVIPDLTITATRLNNFENATTLKVTGIFSKLTVDGSDKNAITANSLKYRTRQDGGAWSAYTNIAFTQSNGAFTASDVFLDLVNSSLFDIEVQVTDKFETISEMITVDRGVPIMFVSDQEKIGINKMPETGGRKGMYLKPEDNLFNLVYPIGSIYMSVNSVNPSTLFGGTWVAWGTGRVPVGVDTSQSEFNTVEKTGGEKTVAIGEGHLPRFGFGFSHHGDEGGAVLRQIRADYMRGIDSPYHGNTYRTVNGAVGGAGSNMRPYWWIGNNEGHNNLQPFITCYMWKRTA